MEGPVAGDGSKKSAQDASSSSKELKKPPRRRLLRRLSSNVGSEASAPTETKACAADDSQMLQKKKQQRQGRPRSQSYSIYLSLSQELDGSPSVRRFTPPLSPSLRSVNQVQTNDVENRVSAAASIAMLKRPGVPALGDITKLKKMVGAAPRAWVLDFKIRGGRSHVNAKLREMELLETAVNPRSPRNVMPKFFRRLNNKTPTHREVVEAREELIQVLLFLHLRE